MSTQGSILIIDDTPANIGVLIDSLDCANYQVLVAESGPNALKTLQHSTPDLILLDVIMPGMDGYETCAKIKANEEWTNIPIIFMTALTDPEDKVRAFAAGAVDYITKPIYPTEVLARVDTHLKIHFLQQQLEDELAMRIEAENLLRQSLNLGVLLIDPENRIIFSTRLTDALLHKYDAQFDGITCSPDLIADNGPLQVRRFSERGHEDITMLILQEKDSHPGPSALLPLGLTAREAEVLYWIAQGKSNPDIATILAASVRTVHKHVENIFRKLGLETRNAAALTALEVLRPSTDSIPS